MVAMVTEGPAQESHHRRGGSVSASEVLDHGPAELQRLPVRLPVDVIAAADSVIDDLRATIVSVWTRLTEIRNAHHDKPRVDGRQALVSQAQAGHYPRSEVLRHDVRPSGHLLYQGPVLGILQVELDTSLIGIEMKENAASLRVGSVFREGPQPPSPVAAGPFNLDHLGPVVRQELRTVRPGDIVSEVQNLQASQRLLNHKKSSPAGKYALTSSRTMLPSGPQ